MPKILAKIKLYLILHSILSCSFAANFGQNKVQYEQLVWQYLNSTHCEIYFHQHQGTLATITGRWIENDYTTLSREFGFIHHEKIPLIVYGSPNLFEQTNVIFENIPEGVGGFTEMFKSRVVVPFTGSYGEYRHVIHHELVHTFEYGILNEYNSILQFNAGIQLPLWFAEGLAEYLSSGWNCEADMFLMDRAVFGEIPPPGPELNNYMAYKGGQSFLFFLAASRGDSTFTRFLHIFRETKRVDAALQKTYGKTLDELGTQWKQQVKQVYWPEIGKRQDPESIGRCLTARTLPRADYSLRPRISPDGKKIAFFSDYADFTKIVVTDLQGKILSRLSQMGYSGHFESFHPFRSGMCWSPQGDRIAFVTQDRGRDELCIVNVSSRKPVKTARFAALSGISSPDWSPDGSRIVFCALHENQSDLFLYSLANDSLTQLTDDIRCEYDPKFSRTGDQIVYTLEDSTGNPRMVNHTVLSPATDLYLMQWKTREIKQITTTPWNEKQACFSADGKHLLFVSDRNGIDNLYSLPIDTADSAKPLTDIIGGCSNPDVARDTNSLVFCLFQKGKWNIYLMDAWQKKLMAKALAPTRWVESLSDTSKPFFTPIPLLTSDSLRDTAKSDSVVRKGKAHRPAGSLSLSQKDEQSTDIIDSGDSTQSNIDTTGPQASSDSGKTAILDSTKSVKKTTASIHDTTPSFTTLSEPREYRLKFSPDMVTLGLGLNSVYGASGQWVAAFSDLLGDHHITLAGDIQGRLDEYAHIFASYLNTKYRVDFGLGGFYSRDYTLTDTTYDSLFHDTNIGILCMLSYPFSTFSRIDFNCYYSNIQRETIDTSTGNAVGSRSFNILVPTLSYVFDNILWGLTGPVNGFRSSATLTAIPPLQSIESSFIAGDIDFRMYTHFARRFVWANRLACGASVPINDDGATRRYFLGGTDYWFNFDVNPENYDNNLKNIFYSDFIVPFRGWRYFDLTGSRYAVFNTEFRFPFISDITLAWPLPIKIQYINGVVFTDVGNAWNKQDEYQDIPLPSSIFGGIGFGLRANLGIFVLRYDRAWKTDWQYYVESPITYFSLGADF